MDYARLLSDGVGSWLQFEHACDRAGLFSEKYLTHPIGQILSARSGNKALAEHAHPVLKDFAQGPGRRPEVDFVILDPYPNIKIAVESKWIGKTRPTVEKLFWDLIRLEMLAHKYGARCFFVLGGTRDSLDKYFAQDPFSGVRAERRARPLLRTDSNLLYKTSLEPNANPRTDILKKLFRNYQNVDFPHRIVSRRTESSPQEGPKKRHQVYVWEISSQKNRKTLRPENSKHYSLDGASQRDFYRRRARAD